MLKIATLADWFGVGVIQGIKESLSCGAEGVQLYAWNELNPFEITEEKIREVRDAANACNQKVTALCGELTEVTKNGRGLEAAAANAPKVEYLKRCFDLAEKLDCNVVTTHIGVVPENKDDAVYAALHDACDEVGSYAAGMGGYLAIETGPEIIPRLCGFVDSCASGRVAINYDPANIVMVTGDDPVAGVYSAAARIVHTHAKDGVMRQYLGPEEVYRLFAEGGVEALDAMPNYFREMALGEGAVPWAAYLQALRDVGYDGYLTIEREVGPNPAADIRMAVEFLKNLLPQLK